MLIAGRKQGALFTAYKVWREGSFVSFNGVKAYTEADPVIDAALQGQDVPEEYKAVPDWGITASGTLTILTGSGQVTEYTDSIPAVLTNLIEALGDWRVFQPTADLSDSTHFPLSYGYTLKVYFTSPPKLLGVSSLTLSDGTNSVTALTFDLFSASVSVSSDENGNYVEVYFAPLLGTHAVQTGQSVSLTHFLLCSGCESVTVGEAVAPAIVSNIAHTSNPPPYWRVFFAGSDEWGTVSNWNPVVLGIRNVMATYYSYSQLLSGSVSGYNVFQLAAFDPSTPSSVLEKFTKDPMNGEILNRMIGVGRINEMNVNGMLEAAALL